VIAVTRLGRSTRDSAERMREQLDRLEAPKSVRLIEP
jgi:hypothetical protein